MRHLRLIVAVIVVSAGIPTAAAHAQSTILVEDSTAAMATQIVDGTVVGTSALEVDGTPFTAHEFAVEVAHVGTETGTIVVLVPGGQTAVGTEVHYTHNASLEIGGRYQLALVVADTGTGAGLVGAVGSHVPVYSVVGGDHGVVSFGSLYAGTLSGPSDYSLNGSKWRMSDFPLTYYVNPAKSGQSVEATVAAVTRGMQVWENDAGSSINLVYGGTTSASGHRLGDGQITISFGVPTIPGSLAVASWTASRIGGELITTEFDIVLNVNQPWANGAAPGSYDIGTVIAHEAGHGLGLGDLTGGTATGELMYFQISANSTKTLGRGDRTAVASLYPYGGPVCDGEAVTVNLKTGTGAPTEQRDVILGTAGDDLIDGLGGNDVICGGGGVDTIYGGHGHDTIHGGDGADRLFGGPGNDRILGGSGNDRIHGNQGKDVLKGDGGADKIFGYADDDRLEGGAGNDVLHGNRGQDVIYGNAGHDKLFGYADDDRLEGGAGNDLIVGNFGDDVLDGGAGADQLTGSDGSDTLHGGTESDIMAGNSGTDSLEGGAGNDLIDGGIGYDWCTDSSGYDSAARCEKVVGIESS